MPEPLTRETLEELRRLREAELAAGRAFDNGEHGTLEAACRLSRVLAASNRLQRAVEYHIDALLAAAERGLGAGDAA